MLSVILSVNYADSYIFIVVLSLINVLCLVHIVSLNVLRHSVTYADYCGILLC